MAGRAGKAWNGTCWAPGGPRLLSVFPRHTLSPGAMSPAQPTCLLSTLLFLLCSLFCQARPPASSCLHLSLSSTCLCPARSASLARPTLPIHVSAPPFVSPPLLSLPHTRGTLGLSRLWRPLTVWWLFPYRSGWWPSWWPPWWPCRPWPSCGRTSGRCSSSPCR